MDPDLYEPQLYYFTNWAGQRGYARTRNPYIDLTEEHIGVAQIISRIRFEDDATLGSFSLMECKVTGEYVDNDKPFLRVKLNKRGHCRVRFKRWKRPSSIIKSAIGWRFYGTGPFITAHSKGTLCFVSKEKALAFLAEWKQSRVQ